MQEAATREIKVWALAVVAGVLLAGMIHIVSILAMPGLSRASAFQRVTASTPLFQTVLLGGARAPAVSPLDPATAVAVCAYDLANGPARVRVETRDQLLTLSFIGDDSRVIYGLTDRAAQKGVIELVLVTRPQLDEALALDEEDEVQGELRVLSPTRRGLAVARVLVGLPSERSEAEALSSGLRCSPAAAKAAPG